MIRKEEKKARELCKIAQGNFCPSCKSKCSYWRFYLERESLKEKVKRFFSLNKGLC